MTNTNHNDAAKALAGLEASDKPMTSLTGQAYRELRDDLLSDWLERNMSIVKSALTRSADAEGVGDESDIEKIAHDLRVFGTAFSKDGKHVPVSEVYATPPIEQRELDDAHLERLASTCAQHLIGTATDPGWANSPDTPKEVILNYLKVAAKQSRQQQSVDVESLKRGLVERGIFMDSWNDCIDHLAQHYTITEKEKS